jgi:hypothetical protein
VGCLIFFCDDKSGLNLSVWRSKNYYDNLQGRVFPVLIHNRCDWAEKTLPYEVAAFNFQRSYRSGSVANVGESADLGQNHGAKILERRNRI